LSDADRNDFLRRLGDLIADGKAWCYAWTLIPNHFHLLLRTLLDSGTLFHCWLGRQQWNNVPLAAMGSKNESSAYGCDGTRNDAGRTRPWACLAPHNPRAYAICWN